MLIRDATPDDAGAIAGVHVRSWRAAYRGIVPDDVLDGLSVDQREANWRGWIADGTPVLVAQCDGELAGFCALNGSEVAALYVDPLRFRAGVGGGLLCAAMDRLRAAGVDEATLWVYEANHRARAFYARYGFVPDGGVQTDPRGAPEIRMRVSLACSGVFSATTQEF